MTKKGNNFKFHGNEQPNITADYYFIKICFFFFHSANWNVSRVRFAKFSIMITALKFGLRNKNLDECYGCLIAYASLQKLLEIEILQDIKYNYIYLQLAPNIRKQTQIN